MSIYSGFLQVEVILSSTNACQSDDAAHRAVTEGKGRLIHGRPCRTEPAKAHRKSSKYIVASTLIIEGTFLLARVFGEPITVAEAREVLRSFGTIENAWMPSNTENSLYGLRGGAFVTFKYYETGRDAMSVSSLKYHRSLINNFERLFVTIPNMSLQ